MDFDVKVSAVTELKICQKCQKIYRSNDLIQLCPECRYSEAKFEI